MKAPEELIYCYMEEQRYTMRLHFHKILFRLHTLKKISVLDFFIYTYISAMEAHIIVNPKFTYYILCAMEAHIIINQKFTNYIKFIVGKTGWVIPDLS